MRCPATSTRPQHSFSPIRFSPTCRKKGLAPRLLNPALLDLGLFGRASLEPAPFKCSLFEPRFSIENPCIHFSGFPSLGTHVAQPCTGCPCASPPPPPRPGFINK